MRQSPFYAYPSSYSFPSPQTKFYADNAYHPLFPRRQHRSPSQPSSSVQPAPSVINIPVFDSASPHPPPSPPRNKAPAAPLIDPVSAAILIQSCFRGFSIRRHNPLLHLRTISTSRKQLEDLKSELESPGFSHKVRSNEKERLRFSESVMAVILRLDAVEGSIPEVRNQRKEATKLAIKLQDAMDATLSEQEEELYPKSVDRGPHDIDPESIEAPAFQKIIPPEDQGSGSGDAEQKEPAEVTYVVQDDPIEAVDNEERYAEQDEPVDAMDCIGSDLSCRKVDPLDGIHAIEGTCVQPAVLGSSTDLCVDSNKDSHEDITCAVLNEGPCMEVNKDMVTCVVMNEDNEDITRVVPATAGEAYEHTDVREEDVKSLGRGASFSPGTPRAENQSVGSDANADDCSPMVEEVLNPQGPIEIGQSQDETLMGVNTTRKDSFHGLHAVPRDGRLPSSDSVLLKKLSEECGELRLMVGKLLAQSKAQSKVICALCDKLEILEHQQQLSLQNNQQQGKRKPKKGSKRCVRCPRSD